MSDDNYNILNVVDSLEDYKITKKNIFNVPHKIIAIGRSGSGKSGVLVNLYGRAMYYKNNFKGDNIFIFSVSARTDDKLKALIALKDIPESNIFSDQFNSDELEAVYDTIKSNFIEDQAEGIKPVHSLIILDDLAYSNDLKGYDKKTNIINKVFMNGRHINASVFLTTQKASLVGTGPRANADGAILFGQLPKKELDVVSEDFNHLPRKQDFTDMYLKHTPTRHDFLVINYHNKNGIYQDKNFKNIKF